MMSPKLKILCLPGWRTSLKIMQIQLNSSLFTKNLQDYVSFEVLQPTFEAQGPPHSIISEMDKDGKFFQWWFIDPSEPRDYKGLDTSAEYVYNYIVEHGPYDGLLGFSQGAALSHYIVARGQNEEKFQNLFKFVILVAGFAPRDIRFQKITETTGPFALPSLHIIGKDDDMAEISKMCAQYYSNSVFLEHEKGHTFPKLEGDKLTNMLDFLKSHVPQTFSRM